jgi:signal transduction histidine kinase
LVVIGIALERSETPLLAVRHLLVGTASDFLLTVAAWGALGATLTALYVQVGSWALLAFLGPTLLTRQVLVRSQALLETAAAYDSREKVLQHLSNKIGEERQDERRIIAADLHDEVLQPLFKTTLMAQVLKNDLTKGRLLDLDDDLPELLAAAELASASLRDLIGNLRLNPLGGQGLVEAIDNLLRRIRDTSPLKLHVSLEEVRLPPDLQLIVYQIAKEAIGNAVHHSRGQNMWIDLKRAKGSVALVVRDDGVGFDITQRPAGHFGIEIMRERATVANGHLFVDSAPGQGCTVAAMVPAPGGERP